MHIQAVLHWVSWYNHIKSPWNHHEIPMKNIRRKRRTDSRSATGDFGESSAGPAFHKDHDHKGDQDQGAAQVLKKKTKTTLPWPSRGSALKAERGETDSLDNGDLMVI